MATANNIAADTIFAELKTDSNKLSVWKIENEEADINDAFVALASNMNSIGTICAVKIAEGDIAGLDFDDELGETPAIDINHKHRNIINLTYGSLGTVINAIIKALQNKRDIRRTRGTMKELLCKAYEDGKIDINQVATSIRNDIEKALEK